MRIVIDLQAAQSPHSRHRGIGRYSLSLAKAMLRQRGDHEIIIALNGMFAESIVPLREAFSGLLRPDDIRVWHATVPPMPMASATDAQRRAAELVRESFLASLEPDIVHVASMFETSAYAVTGLHDGQWGLRTAITLYDLIPHIYPDVYLPTPKALAEYEEKIGHLRQADLLLAISESSRQEALERLGLPPARVVTISSAVEDHFAPAVVPPGREAELRERHALRRPFAMYTGGINHRKNIEGLIRAWSALPARLLESHQLAIVCAMQPLDRERLEALVRESGLPTDAVALTGFVPEEDLVDLYRLCKLFVFPSQHEGFGLPALEAMRCGAPVIGANNSSIPEVIGRADALFDAHSDAAITARIEQGLVDDEFRASLAVHGIEQARRFDWDESARVALAAMEKLVGQERPVAAPASTAMRPRLALVTPMPPQPSGIADASADLLPALARHYEIDLITDQPEVAPLPEGLVRARHSAQWFMDHGGEYDRILYQFGNSEFHAFQFELLARHPGVVVLHDFFLGGVQAHREVNRRLTLAWTRALYESHGWGALVERCAAGELTDLMFKYPSNFPVLRPAGGVVVHSRHALEMARDWYGESVTRAWRCVPLLRAAAPKLDRAAARARLGIAPETFLVCSFGHLGRTKLNHRLLQAWQRSGLSRSADCRLVYVGQLGDGTYAASLRRDLALVEQQVHATGWVGHEQYRDWLAAADVGVQLRAMSRGETSAAVLDCMGQGLATIANREGSMADLDPVAVWLLPEEFSDPQLSDALEQLRRDPERRDRMGQRARSIVQRDHAPAACAAAYGQAIEEAVVRQARGMRGLVAQLGDVLRADDRHAEGAGWDEAIARAVAQNLPLPRPARQLAVDITPWIYGPQASDTFPPFLLVLLQSMPAGWRAEPVRFDPDGTWRYARSQTLRHLGAGSNWLADEPVDLQPGDLWSALPPPEAPPLPPPQRVLELGLPMLRLPVGGESAVAAALAAGTAPCPGQRQWFVDISELVWKDWQSGIQRVVKNYLLELMLDPPAGTTVVPVYAGTEQQGYRIARNFALGVGGMTVDPPIDPPIDPRAGDVFFGLDLQPKVVPAQAPYLRTLAAQGVKLAFMVYDLLPVRLPECFIPRGNEPLEHWLRVVAEADHAICISQATADDFARWLAENGLGAPRRIDTVHLGADLAHSLPSSGRPPDADSLLDRIRARPCFLMVGTLEPRKGHAAVLAAIERLWEQGGDVGLVISGREGWMVKELLERLRSHPESGRRLFLFDDTSDEFLAEIYGASACLVAASRGEGFGLPLVEAAQRGLPIIARELPVFREIAGENAFYFSDDAPDALASRMREWLALRSRGSHPVPDGLEWRTWRESARRIRELLQEDAQSE